VTNSHFIAISAVLAGIKDIRGAIDEAQDMLDRDGRPTVIFVDEIHSFNKTQQDALLPHVESGLLTLIGGTTEHPGMQVTNALLSRAQVYNLQPLSQDDFRELYERARTHLPAITVDEDALALLGGYADGDGRRFLNLLEQVANAASGAAIVNVDAVFAGSATSPSLRRADKSGDSYYEQISAFHKSVRGSQPDAALYWLARMLDGGVDPRQVTRRMIAIASEDIGNADPRALTLALEACAVYERLGSPEGELAIAQAIVFMACAAKSNAVYAAFNAASEDAAKLGSLEVPLHLRNAPTRLMKEIGYGKGYRYAHDEPGGFAAGERYFPDEMPDRRYYVPVTRGLEIKIGEALAARRAKS
jgi:putative ATPase